MTEVQRHFAAEHHNLIFSFLHDRGWPVDEYYDIAVFGYLRSVMRYLSVPTLQRYAFSTIAWRTMGQSIASYQRAEKRRLASEQKYMGALPTASPDPYEELEATILLHDLASMSTSEQYALASMRLQGYSIAETARLQGMSPKRVHLLLKELYRVYLNLYHE